MTAEHPALRVQHGAQVVSRDGRVLGTVCAVEGGYFQMDAGGARRYWLSATHVAQQGSDAVQLRVPHRQLATVRIEG